MSEGVAEVWQGRVRHRTVSQPANKNAKSRINHNIALPGNRVACDGVESSEGGVTYGGVCRS